MKKHEFIAFDLGASGGRAMAGTLDKSILKLEEIHRFPNRMMNIQGSCFWNIFGIFEHLIRSLQVAAEQDRQPESLAVDTWGVDFGLVDRRGMLLGLPYAYRDHRTDQAMEEVFSIFPKKQIYELTGIGFWQFNSLYQLYAWKRDQPEVLDAASRILFMPDLFNYLLCGQMKTEFTYATTSQLYNPHSSTWEPLFFYKLGISQNLMCEVVQPGTVIGGLNQEITDRNGLKNMLVTAVASHDTGSAIAAIPAENDDWAFLSSGTWSVMGMETDQPIISEAAMKYNFTNEGGVEKTYRFLKNIMGLWLLQESMRIWHTGGKKYTHREITGLAAKAPRFRAFINPDWMGFYNPPDMPSAISRYLKESGQKHDLDQMQMTRCILESLAMHYRKVLDQLSEVSGKIFTKLHIIGGGTRNELLCQFTANATGIPVAAGPTEATACGNLMVQAMTRGYVNSLQEIRIIVRNSFKPKTYFPENVETWENAYSRFLELTSVSNHL